MSTFKGIVAEFPQIRIDYFRVISGQKPPLACFLSHVHSDHLLGLESLKSPFIYCSPATREILLRLEKYPHRMNFAKGILESRKQTYKHLQTLLKTLPLETPTAIELSPGNEIRVTLFAANHCAGAVMFLIQGDGKAILYTGDIRSETWWVNSLVQNPVLIPYTLGPRRLDCIYLDTTFATKSEPYREFPSKSEGVRELLEKVEKYPKDTLFYFQAWTFGYENVWIALSAFLESTIHLDQYRWGIYKSLSTRADFLQSQEAPPLCGFHCGNHYKEGCLTGNPHVRLHSCERGTSCPVIEESSQVVSIIPIVTRLSNGVEIGELGAGGGKGDLNQIHELEINDPNAVGQLMQLCAAKLEDPELLSKIFFFLSSATDETKNRILLDTNIKGDDLHDDTSLLGDIPLQELVSVLARVATTTPSSAGSKKQLSNTGTALDKIDGPLPKFITFPYSRHSSYSELCSLVRAFRPRDIYPCTVDPINWTSALSIRALFGHLCSADLFAHDAEMTDMLEERRERMRADKRQRPEDTQTTEDEETQHSAVVRNESLAEHENSSTMFFTPPVVAERSPNGSAPRGNSTLKPPVASEAIGLGISITNDTALTRAAFRTPALKKTTYPPCPRLSAPENVITISSDSSTNTSHSSISASVLSPISPPHRKAQVKSPVQPPAQPLKPGHAKFASWHTTPR